MSRALDAIIIGAGRAGLPRAGRLTFESLDTLRSAVPVHPMVSKLIPMHLLGLDEGQA